MNLLFLLLIFICITICIYCFSNIYKTNQYNKEIEIQNNLLQQKYEQTKIQYNQMQSDLALLSNTYNQTKAAESKIKQNIEDLKQIEQSYEDTANKSFVNYCNILDKQYQEKEEEYLQITGMLINSYNIKQNELAAATNEMRIDLDKMKQTRAAAIVAARKEKELEKDYSFYCVVPSQDELDDILVLERVKSKLNKPRILCMLIWSTYYQKRMTELCNNILGTKVVTGIYKITNQKTKQCYVGQAVDISTRWKNHAKCGLGIDTPTTNKLYQSMLEYGLWNFTFELLEECPKEQLNEKEKFYISLYDSCNYGFNSTVGNK